MSHSKLLLNVSHVLASNENFPLKKSMLITGTRDL